MAKEQLLKNPTGLKQLDAILEALTKKRGEDYSPEDFGNATFTTTGSLTFDCLLKRGGICNGRIIELIGETGSLKTSLALTLIAERQKWRKANGITGKYDIILDLEFMLERSFIEGFGIDMSQIIWKRFTTAEAALEFIIETIKSDCIDYVMLDSIAAMQNERQLKRSVGEADMGGISKEMNTALRQLCKLVEIHHSTLILINQVLLNPGAGMYQDPRTTPGGKAAGYFSRMRFMLKTAGKKHEEAPGCAKMTIQVMKNSFAAPIDEDIVLAFRYGKGFDLVYDVEAAAKEVEILKHSAGQTKVKWTSESEWEPLLPDIEKGKEAGQTALRNNPQLLERLRHACLRIAGVPGAKEDNEFTTVTV